MNHAISINSDKTLVITLPEGTQVDRVMIRKMGTQESKLYWRNEVLDQYKWERDIAIQQLKELGYGFGQEPKTDGDTISRKAAVSRISDLLILELKGERIPTWNEVYSALNELPSVQSELAKYSPKLDNENGDLISRQAAIDAVSEACFELRGVFGRCEDALKALPSTQPRKGKWILKKELVPLPCDSDPLDWDNYDEDTHSEWKEFYHCSSCDWKSGDFEGGNFCRNCGADMRGGQDE